MDQEQVDPVCAKTLQRRISAFDQALGRHIVMGNAAARGAGVRDIDARFRHQFQPVAQAGRQGKTRAQSRLLRIAAINLGPINGGYAKIKAQVQAAVDVLGRGRIIQHPPCAINHAR